MQASYPITDEVVLIGGGHAHALVLKKWAMKPVPGVRLTVINPAPTAPYTGMLPGYVAGHYAREALEIDLVQLARHAGARLILGAATGIDRVSRHVSVSGRADVFYDLVSVDIGITSEMPEIPGFGDHAHAAKPLGPFAAAWADYLRAPMGDIVVIGGGVAGVELALAMAHSVRQLDAAINLTVIEQSDHLLDGIGSSARKALLRHLTCLQVRAMTGVSVTKVAVDHVELSDGRAINTRFVTGAAGARPHAWLADSGLKMRDGFITVDKTLRSPTDQRVFAVGDCADLAFSPRPKAGVFAVRQAPVLLHNIGASLLGKKLHEFRPQKDYLKLISTGGRGAVADKYGLRLDGPWLWRWKDRIDRKFMDQFLELPTMPAPPIPKDVSLSLQAELAGAEPLCGGCGAKVGRGALEQGLSLLPLPKRPDVLSGRGDDAAILAHGDQQQVFTTDHLRAFVEDPWLMTQIAANHAMGDIWAMGATPQAALVQVILPQMAARLQAEVLREIMAAANAAFEPLGADIVGGHTSVGAELTIGFSLTGLLDRPAIGVAGAREGDALILTKPIGSGTILAGEMRKQARGEWVAEAYRLMLVPQARPSEILAPVAHAMTDVTGFGLAGHLMTILKASGVGAAIDLSAVPVMDGASVLASRGVRSSLWQTNVQAVPEISPRDDPRWNMLFDPQTAGGLLAAVPADKAQTLIAELAAGGIPAAMIGHITKGAPFIRC